MTDMRGRTDVDEDQDRPAGVSAQTCTGCGVLLVPGTTATGVDECADCLYGPPIPAWTDDDDEIPPACRGCGDALIPGATALPPGHPARAGWCRECVPVPIAGDVAAGYAPGVVVDVDDPTS
ncbi:hypothetical protein [Candidatus Frankia alpina]|uniref:hypothetical protein n=3 Tax=Candidatus Frankia alpina TaxID=2699483 RepID=UPI00138747D3|nr:hypothetical protein [Candidatus Frankia alpina]